MHQEEKYVRYFERVRDLLTEKCPELQVVQNEVPESMQSQFYIESTTGASNERHIGKTKFPRTGAFEIMFRGEYIFSKLTDGIWPHPDLVTTRVRDILDGNASVTRSSPKKSPLRRKSPTRSLVGFNPKPANPNPKARTQPQSQTVAPKAVPAKKESSSSSSDEDRKEKSFDSRADPSYNDSFAEDKESTPEPKPKVDSAKSLPKAEEVKQKDSVKSLPKAQEETKGQISASSSKSSVQSKPPPQASNKDLHSVKGKEDSSSSSDEEEPPRVHEASHHSLPKDASERSLPKDASERSLPKDASERSLPKDASERSLPKEASQKSLAKEASKHSLAHEDSKKSIASKQSKHEDSHSEHSDKESEHDKKSEKSKESHEEHKDSHHSSHHSESDREEEHEAKPSEPKEESEEESEEKHEEAKEEPEDSSDKESDHSHDSGSKKSDKSAKDSDREGESEHSDKEDDKKVTKSYSIKINLSQLVHKKIPYTNEESEDRVYEIKSSDPDLMDVKESVVEMPAGSHGKFKLTFAPVDEEMQKTFYLYVTSYGEVKECIEIKTKYEPAEA
eukprot:CAMPEP_0204904116 /NCGR_PEP_ID=MMETSP1397-20131031/4671_1 /ASSEMBLY_ACC=CAM_ASM_000891 /TAXON_ID=49980 /ORGANISM="Climacostomum Climacostomum virens, Strain Stock W-24" /LENGTH=561 /DNA_ID=CAMNT_0052072853 /DNA_START=65 /DNA_END=1750 /DNA_ORIENTATION=+